MKTRWRSRCDIFLINCWQFFDWISFRPGIRILQKLIWDFFFSKSGMPDGNRMCWRRCIHQQRCRIRCLRRRCLPVSVNAFQLTTTCADQPATWMTIPADVMATVTTRATTERWRSFRSRGTVTDGTNFSHRHPPAAAGSGRARSTLPPLPERRLIFHHLLRRCRFPWLLLPPQLLLRPRLPLRPALPAGSFQRSNSSARGVLRIRWTPWWHRPDSWPFVAPVTANRAETSK